MYSNRAGDLCKMCTRHQNLSLYPLWRGRSLFSDWVKFFLSHSSSKLLSKSYHAYGQCLNSNASHIQMGTSNRSAGLLVQKVVSFHMNAVSCWIVCTGSLYNFQSLEPSFLLRKAERVSMVSFRFLGGPLYRFSRHTINRLAVHKINSAGNYY